MADRICYAICKFFFQNCIERAIIFVRFTKMQKKDQTGIFTKNYQNIGDFCFNLYINQSSDIKCFFRRPRLFLGGV